MLGRNCFGSVVAPRTESPRAGAGVAVGCEADDCSSAGRLRTVFVEPGASAWTAQGRRIRASAMHESARRIRAGNGRSTTGTRTFLALVLPPNHRSAWDEAASSLVPWPGFVKHKRCPTG